MTDMLKKLGAVLVIAAVGATLTACAGQGPRGVSQGAPTIVTAVPEYRLGSGDKLRFIVYGEQDLSGEFDVDASGSVSLPLIGEIRAGGKTLRELEVVVADKFREGYLTDPRVNIDVLNYRPYYIVGEVQEPGEFPYSAGMTVLNALAVAGGYTYRADTSRVYVARPNQGGEIEYAADQNLKVSPGDIIRVPERFF
ncbi:MAG: polysaccharide biosynthesis protein [Rhodobiaceae bacterium]|nr:MAG: polysaccharide biosynthesis protein [Rhodobiaceae bacterium]